MSLDGVLEIVLQAVQSKLFEHPSRSSVIYRGLSTVGSRKDDPYLFKDRASLSTAAFQEKRKSSRLHDFLLHFCRKYDQFKR